MVFTSEDTSIIPVLDSLPYPEMPPIDIMQEELLIF